MSYSAFFLVKPSWCGSRELNYLLLCDNRCKVSLGSVVVLVSGRRVPSAGWFKARSVLGNLHSSDKPALIRLLWLLACR